MNTTRVRPGSEALTARIALGSVWPAQVGSDIDAYWCADARCAVASHYRSRRDESLRCAVVFKMVGGDIAFGVDAVLLSDGKLHTATVFRQSRCGGAFADICRSYCTTLEYVRHIAEGLPESEFTPGGRGLIPTGVQAP